MQAEVGSWGTSSFWATWDAALQAAVGKRADRHVSQGGSGRRVCNLYVLGQQWFSVSNSYSK